MKTLAVIPAYMEEETIRPVVEKAQRYVDQVIVIDDGSTDNTAVSAKAAGATVIRHRKNKGYGAAIQSSFYTARKYNAESMVILDADAQHDPDEIPLLLNALKEQNLDVVIGSRFLDKENGNHIPAYRKIGIKVLDKLTHLFSSGNYDTQSGFRAYSNRAIQLLEPNETGMGASSELIMKAQELGLAIGQVPITVRYDTRKPPRSPIKHGVTVIISVIKLVTEKHPLIFFGLTGMILVAGGVVSGTGVIRRFNEAQQLPVGTALIAAILIMLGSLLITSAMTLYAIQDTIKRAIKEQETHKKIMELNIVDEEKIQ